MVEPNTLRLSPLESGRIRVELARDWRETDASFTARSTHRSLALLRRQVRVEQTRRLALVAGHQVAVQIHRDRDLRVPHVLAQRLRVDAGRRSSARRMCAGTREA